MLGFVFGAMCLFVLLFALRRRHHARWAYAGCGPRGGWGGPGFGGPGWGPGWGRGGPRGRRGFGAMGSDGFARAAGEVFKRRLDIDEEQEGIVDHALIDLRTALTELRGELGATRAGLAAAFAGESVDEAALAGAFARHDDALARARRQAVSAAKQIHAVLRPEQRTRAAEWLGRLGEA